MSKSIHFINLSNVIHSIYNVTISGDETWTATQDCWCVAEIYATVDNLYNAELRLDNVCIAKNSNIQSIVVSFPIRKGQIFKKHYGNCSARFYAVF